MDIEKLIENAKVCCGDIETEDCSRYCIDPRDSRDSGLRWCRQWLIHDLHTALSTLQTENKKLRAELEQVRRERDAAQSLLAERIGVRGAEPITTAFGLSLDRLRELAQADREGKIHPKYTIGETIYDRFGEFWTVDTVELHSLYTKNEWLYRCGHDGTDDYCALWEFESFPSKEAALRREQE